MYIKNIMVSFPCRGADELEGECDQKLRESIPGHIYLHFQKMHKRNGRWLVMTEFKAELSRLCENI